MKKLFTIVALLVVLCGCGKKPSSNTSKSNAETNAVLESIVIEGQAFVVLKNGESIKLGLVPVLLVDSNEALKHVINAESEFRIGYEEIESKRKRFAKQSDDAMRRYSDAMSRNSAAYDEERKWRDYAAKLDNGFSTYNELQKSQAVAMYANAKAKIADLESKGRNSLAEMKMANEDSRRANSEAHEETKALLEFMHDGTLFSPPPKPIAFSATDADGRFKIQVTNQFGALFVFAAFDREIAGEKEHYRWMFPLNSKTNIQLNNATMLESGVWPHTILSKHFKSAIQETNRIASGKVL